MTISIFKLKPGAGAIIAFIILAIVFASIAGVVFIAVNQSHSKNIKASNDYTATGLKFTGPISCTGTTAKITFTWNRAVMAGWSNREDFNLSTSSNFSSFVASVDVSGKNTITYDVPRNQVLYARIATLYNASTWAFSDTKIVSNLTCPIYVIDRFRFTINPTILNSPEKYVSILFTPTATANTRLRILRSQSISDVEKESNNVIEGKTSYTWNTKKTGTFYVVMVDNFDGVVSDITEFYVHNRCDMNLDRALNSKDASLLASNLGAVPPRNAKYDINGDFRVNTGDQGILSGAIINPTSAVSTKYCF